MLLFMMWAMTHVLLCCCNVWAGLLQTPSPAFFLVLDMQAMLQLCGMRSNSITGLNHLNHYVSSTLDQLQAAQKPTPWLLRQDASSLQQPSSTGLGAGMGISSFAFQGTNAHAILVTSEGTAAMVPIVPSLPAQTWQRRRFWFTVVSHQMLGRCTAVNLPQKTAVLQLNLRAAHLSYLQDHRVKGRALFPAAAMLEAALGAVGTAHQTPADGDVVALTGVGISAPLVMAVDAEHQVAINLDYSDGKLEVVSGQGSKLVVHSSGYTGKGC
jgi:acyl transferase domain-containing protein